MDNYRLVGVGNFLTSSRLRNGSRYFLLYSRTNRGIYFRDADNLKEIRHTFVGTTEQPGLMCAASTSLSSSSLLFVDYQYRPLQVGLLDCSASPPELMEGESNILKDQCWMHDMCVTNQGGKELLVGTYGRSGTIMQAVNICSHEVEWQIERGVLGKQSIREPHDLTTDGQGHLFVNDSINDSSVQLLSFGGKHLSCVLQKGEQSLGEMRSIRWSKILNGLLVIHRKEKANNYVLSFVKFY